MTKVGMIMVASLAMGWNAAGEAGMSATPDTNAVLITPAEWLKAQPKPVFRQGHTLPPLTRYGWTLPFDARVELTENWGYALEFGGYVDAKTAETALTDPKSDGAKCLELAAKDPKRYPLVLICSRQLPTNAPAGTWARDADGKLLDAKAVSMDGTVWHAGMNTVYSPEAPDSYWKEAGALRADPIRRIREKCPIAIVLNGGEYGLGVIGFAGKVWERDPAIVKAKGDKPWYDYVSERKARAEILIADAVKAAVPDRQLYVYYTTSGGLHRNHTGDWRDWFHGYEWMKPVSDLASSEHYHRHFNSGWTGTDDLLTQALNSKGFEIANGQPLSYEWLCAGWPREKGLGAGTADAYQDGGLGDLARYKGFIRCLYVAGMVGGNAGYYAYPKGGFGVPFPTNDPPHWLKQMVALAEVHAQFSHLEPFLRNGELLPGPDKHAWSKDQPAYEFPTGDAGTRVLVRRLRGKPEWILAAWAADGKARAVRVTVPDLGLITLQAKPEGTVYKAVRKGETVESAIVEQGG